MTSPVGERPMALTDFLLARIAEDEEAAPFVYAEQFTPARVLAECEAKRRIVGEHEGRWITPENWWACQTCGTPGEYDVMWPCPTLRFLALPYADHPDYREEWRV